MEAGAIKEVKLIVRRIGELLVGVAAAVRLLGLWVLACGQGAHRRLFAEFLGNGMRFHGKKFLAHTRQMPGRKSCRAFAQMHVF